MKPKPKPKPKAKEKSKPQPKAKGKAKTKPKARFIEGKGSFEWSKMFFRVRVSVLYEGFSGAGVGGR
jgi:hypothetical protein